VVALLASLQFSIVLDFMIISLLGAIIMPDLNIGPQRFGEIVSACAFSAGASGLLAAGFADRFDRKRFLLFFYCGSSSVRRSSLGPVDLHIGLRADDLPIVAVHHVEVTVARRVRYELARLPGNVAVDQDVGADLVVIP